MGGNVKPGSGLLVVLRRKTANGQSVTINFTTLFSVSDHLGSTRVVMDAAGTILERNAYYPFGLQTDQGNDFPNMSSTLPALYPRYINPSATRRDLYNGKEIQSIAGTDYLDYGFRQYDPVTARCMAVDPKAEKYLTLTPYSYCAGNPIITIDYNGADTVFMNPGGEELKRIVSSSNVTFVKDLNSKKVQLNNLTGTNHVGWIEAKMPGVVSLREDHINLSDDIYQKYDYLIAAEVSYFNHLIWIQELLKQSL